MEIFVTLLVNLVPLYVLIALGWVARRYCSVDRQSLSALAIFIIQPIVSFGFVAQLEFHVSYILIPILVFLIFSGLLLATFKFSQNLYPDKRANLLAMCSASGNTGYFGLPLAILLLDAQWVGVYIFANLGALVCEATTAYYIANRGQFDAKQSFKRVLQFPTIYAIAAGLVVNFAQIDLPALVYDYWAYFKGCYIVIGMMIIGVSLGRIDSIKIGWRFLSVAFAVKFVIWPIIAFALIMLDRMVLHWYDTPIHQILFIIAIVPQAANTSAFAAQLDLNPEKAASTILIGTIFALFYIPLILLVSGLY